MARTNYDNNKKFGISSDSINANRTRFHYNNGPALEIGLGRFSICQKISRKILYRIQEIYGMELHNLFITMGISHIQSFLDHTRRKTLTDMLLIASSESLKLKVGIHGSIFYRKF